MNYTIDASVLIASARTHEPNHDASLDFLDQLQTQGPSVFCPSITLAECEAVFPREQTFDEILAPIRREVEESGITDEELDELFMQARRDYYREGRSEDERGEAPRGLWLHDLFASRRA